MRRKVALIADGEDFSCQDSDEQGAVHDSKDTIWDKGSPSESPKEIVF